VDVPDPNTVIEYRDTNIYGSVVRMGRRTGAHLDHTRVRLAEQHPGADVAIIQGAFNTDVPASAGTHDFDGCLDVYVPGMEWTDQQRFFRACGWAAWWRYPPLFGHHIHMISLGCTGRMGIYVPGQIADYLATPPRSGLSGHVEDPTWHPSPIKSTIFDFADYLRLEDDMQLSDTFNDHKFSDGTVGRLFNDLERMIDNSRRRDQSLAAAVDRGFADLITALDDTSDDVRKKVHEARQTVVAAVRRELDAGLDDR